MQVKKVTPVLFAQEVEPCLKFWGRNASASKRRAEVPDGDQLAFAMLQEGNIELTDQSYASADIDVGTTISPVVRKGPTFLDVEVDHPDETIKAVKGTESQCQDARPSTAQPKSASKTQLDTASPSPN